MPQTRGKMPVFLAAVCCAFCLVFLAGVGDALAGKWKERSKQHEADCNKWCAEHQDSCSHCSTLPGCGKGYTSIESWTGYGKNWYACAKRVKKDKYANSESRARCRRWCGGTAGKAENCVKCSRKKGCGAGYERIRDTAFAKSNEKTWYACRKRVSKRKEASRINLENCMAKCKELALKGCKRCSRKPDCGKGYERLRWDHGKKYDGFTGRGNNYYLCKKRVSRKEAGRLNKEKCEKYCANANRNLREGEEKYCKYCSKKASCGSDEQLVKFGGRGQNWYACGRSRF